MSHRRRVIGRQLRQAIYRLKREKGQPIALYRQSVGEFNFDTGKSDVTRTKIDIRKAIVLPLRGLYKFDYDLTFIAANKNFTYGADFRVGDREILIDLRDLPKDYEILLSDYIVYDGDRYDIVSMQVMDYRVAVFLHLRHTQEQQPYQILTPNVQQRLYIRQRVTGVVE